MGPPKGEAYQRPRPCRPLLEGISGRPNSTSDIPRGFYGTAVANGTPLPEDLTEGKIEGPSPFFRFRTRAQSVGAASDNQDAANDNQNPEFGATRRSALLMN